MSSLPVRLPPLRRFSALPAMTAVVLAMACRTPVQDEAFRVPRDEFLATTRTIAVLPIYGAGRGSSHAAREIEARIEGALVAAGFVVVPATTFRDLWAREERASGGLFDPHTGELDKAEFARVKGRCLTQLARTRAFEAVLVPSLEVVGASFWGGYARWDGSEERMHGTGELDARIEDYEGVLRALSLRVEIHDLQGEDLYASRGGIQTLTRIEGGGFVDLEADRVLVDSDLYGKAVRVALAPLVEDR